MAFVNVPPELLFPVRDLLKSRGLDIGDDQAFDLLVGVGIEVLQARPDLLLSMDSSLATGPFLETIQVRLPGISRPSVAILQNEMARALDKPVGLAAAARLAAAVGSQALGLPTRHHWGQ